eukprot:365892-Chlamydomonas_euryale.AAC.8
MTKAPPPPGTPKPTPDAPNPQRKKTTIVTRVTHPGEGGSSPTASPSPSPNDAVSSKYAPRAPRAPAANAASPFPSGHGRAGTLTPSAQRAPLPTRPPLPTGPPPGAPPFARPGAGSTLLLPW